MTRNNKLNKVACHVLYQVVEVIHARIVYWQDMSMELQDVTGCAAILYV